MYNKNERNDFSPIETGDKKRKKTGCFLISLILLGIVIYFSHDFFSTFQYKDLIPGFGSTETETSPDSAKTKEDNRISVWEKEKGQEQELSDTLAASLLIEEVETEKIEIVQAKEDEEPIEQPNTEVQVEKQPETSRTEKPAPRPAKKPVYNQAVARATGGYDPASPPPDYNPETQLMVFAEDLDIPVSRKTLAVYNSWGTHPLRKVSNKAGKYGIMFLDTEELVIPYEYDDFLYFLLDPTTGAVAVMKRGGKVGLIAADNSVVIPFEYDRLRHKKNSPYIAATKNGRDGIISRRGRIIVPFEYEQILEAPGTYHIGIKAVKNGRTGMINVWNEILVPLRANRRLPLRICPRVGRLSWGGAHYHRHTRE